MAGMGAMVYGGPWNTGGISSSTKGHGLDLASRTDYAHGRARSRHCPKSARLLQEGRAAEREARKLDPDLKSSEAKEKDGHRPCPAARGRGFGRPSNS